MLKREFGGVFIANESFTAARTTVAAGDADAVAFGKAAIANPDLVERIRTHALERPAPRVFYGEGPDYPTLLIRTTTEASPREFSVG
jgi:2,4-dienoyl-CoA reductase-like NADH-dependent reductase (Old Yellow Enzyme family)